MLAEKFYLIVWIWLFIMCILNTLNLLMWLWNIMISSNIFDFVMSKLVGDSCLLFSRRCLRFQNIRNPWVGRFLVVGCVNYSLWLTREFAPTLINANLLGIRQRWSRIKCCLYGRRSWSLHSKVLICWRSDRLANHRNERRKTHRIYFHGCDLELLSKEETNDWGWNYQIGEEALCFAWRCYSRSSIRRSFLSIHSNC